LFASRFLIPARSSIGRKSRTRRVRRGVSFVALSTVAVTVILPTSGSAARTDPPLLVGRAVLPAKTEAEGPPSGTLLPAGVVNEISFPFDRQPVEGFSAIIDGRTRGEVLAMPDNGFGMKATSRDFLIRAYYLRFDFKTASGGSGAVHVGEFIEFRDPSSLIGLEIVNEGSARRLLTGGDIDPESLQRAKNGDLWVGDEFGPWILHFDETGVLLDPPFALPDGLRSPNNPLLDGAPATHPNSRGIEAMAITPNGRHLYAILEGAPTAQGATLERQVLEFSIRDEAFTGRVFRYHTDQTGHMIADATALDDKRIALIERDGGLGTSALFRNIYTVDLRRTDSGGVLDKTLVADLTRIADPNLVSLPAIHPGDLGLGDPFWVMCESVEAIHQLTSDTLLIGCDNNLPNRARQAQRADDNEFIVIEVAHVKQH
jgi:hypothetical protein